MWIMKKLMDSPRAEIVLKLLPRYIADEIFRLAAGRREGLFGIREIRIRRHGVCSLLVGREDIRLFSTVSDRDMDKIVEGVTGGALYAHRDSIAEGYINLPRGIRVGVCGSAAYDGEGLVGISNMTSSEFSSRISFATLSSGRSSSRRKQIIFILLRSASE